MRSVKVYPQQDVDSDEIDDGDAASERRECRGHDFDTSEATRRRFGGWKDLGNGKWQRIKVKPE